jgi:hypothetical protein
MILKKCNEKVKLYSNVRYPTLVYKYCMYRALLDQIPDHGLHTIKGTTLAGLCHGVPGEVGHHLHDL